MTRNLNTQFFIPQSPDSFTDLQKIFGVNDVKVLTGPLSMATYTESRLWHSKMNLRPWMAFRNVN